MYIKFILTLFVLASAFLAWELHRTAAPLPAARSETIVAPNHFKDALSRKVDSIEVEGMPAEDLVRLLHKKSGVEIHVFWETFTLLRTDRVTISLANVRLDEALIRLFEGEVNGDLFRARHVSFNTFGNRVEVQGDAGPGSGPTIRVYDIRDLLSDEYWGVKTPTGAEEKTRLDRAYDLVHLIDSHVDIGGAFQPMFTGTNTGSAQTELYAGRLIITQTPVGQECVANVLAWLRKMR